MEIQTEFGLFTLAKHFFCKSWFINPQTVKKYTHKKKLYDSVCTHDCTQCETKRFLNTEAMQLKKIPTEELFDCKMQIFYKEGSSTH